MEKRAEVPTTPRVDDKFLGVTLSFELAKFHTHKVFFQNEKTGRGSHYPEGRRQVFGGTLTKFLSSLNFTHAKF